MTKRPACRRLGPRALGLGVRVGVLAAAAWSAPAGAQPSPPGPLSSLQGNQWIAFTPSSSGQTVTLNVQVGTNPPGGANLAPPFFTSPYWPTEWSADDGAVILDYSGPSPGCPSTATSCTFTINPMSAAGSHSGVIFEAGPVPDSVTDPGGDPNPWTVTIPTTPTTTTTTTLPVPTTTPGPNATFTGPPNNQLTGPGAFMFTAPGQTSEGNSTYAWQLSSNGGPVSPGGSGSQQSFTVPASIFSMPTATYTLTLTVTDGLGAFARNSVQFEVETQVGQTPTPQAPSSPPAAGRPSGPVLGRTTLNAVSYAPQLARFATPTPGAVQPVTVIWLWRPNWFQSAQTAKTDGRPSAVKRADVSVDPSRSGSGQSATPELAALAAFGIFGFGWVLFKRRRVRSALLD